MADMNDFVRWLFQNRGTPQVMPRTNALAFPQYDQSLALQPLTNVPSLYVPEFNILAPTQFKPSDQDQRFVLGKQGENLLAPSEEPAAEEPAKKPKAKKKIKIGPYTAAPESEEPDTEPNKSVEVPGSFGVPSDEDLPHPTDPNAPVPSIGNEEGPNSTPPMDRPGDGIKIGPYTPASGPNYLSPDLSGLTPFLDKQTKNGQYFGPGIPDSSTNRLHSPPYGTPDLYAEPWDGQFRFLTEAEKNNASFQDPVPQIVMPDPTLIPANPDVPGIPGRGIPGRGSELLMEPPLPIEPPYPTQSDLSPAPMLPSRRVPPPQADLVLSAMRGQTRGARRPFRMLARDRGPYQMGPGFL